MEIAMDLIVGGQSDAIGILEFSTRRTLGLQPEHNVVDVGCGSGRLAVKLAPYLRGKYFGTDILPELTAYARKISRRDDWEFHTTASLGIPVPDGCADFVCFFSVFTHLLHEDIYKYLIEAKRVLRPGGKVVFSFLDFAVPSHWMIFDLKVADSNPNRVLNMFVSKDAIQAWSQHLELDVTAIHDGHQPWIELVQSFTYVDGRVAAGVAEFGQSIGVLTRRG
ncbi:MAG: class I SAM-dependent methyltransferase [Opitutus sp.]|nr:class I SAM-dependent methyltransferase [Opitutus sp.]